MKPKSFPFNAQINGLLLLLFWPVVCHGGFTTRPKTICRYSSGLAFGKESNTRMNNPRFLHPFPGFLLMLVLVASDLNAADTGPVIRVQPQDQIVAPGGTATNRVDASGPPPLYYQWSLNGRTLAGATNSLLVISNVQYVDTGRYRVVVSNAFGVATSTPTKLTLSGFTQPFVAFWETMPGIVPTQTHPYTTIYNLGLGALSNTVVMTNILTGMPTYARLTITVSATASPGGSSGGWTDHILPAPGTPLDTTFTGFAYLGSSENIFF
jgi:hypothetical protein